MSGAVWLVEAAAAALLVAGTALFLAGTVGMLRFPDALSRLHALTKADNLGLFLLALGLALRAPGWTDVAKLAAVWLLVLLASATTAHLIARRARADDAGAAREAGA